MAAKVKRLIKKNYNAVLQKPIYENRDEISTKFDIRTDYINI